MKEVEQLLKSLDVILEKEAKGENIDQETFTFDKTGQWKLEKGIKTRLAGVFGAMKDRVSKLRNKPKMMNHEDATAKLRGEQPHPDLGTPNKPKLNPADTTPPKPGSIPIPRRPGDELRPWDKKPSGKPINIPINEGSHDTGHAAAADAHHSAAKAHLSAAKVHSDKAGKPPGMPPYPKTPAASKPAPASIAAPKPFHGAEVSHFERGKGEVSKQITPPAPEKAKSTAKKPVKKASSTKKNKKK